MTGKIHLVLDLEAAELMMGLRPAKPVAQLMLQELLAEVAANDGIVAIPFPTAAQLVARHDVDGHISALIDHDDELFVVPAATIDMLLLARPYHRNHAMATELAYALLLAQSCGALIATGQPVLAVATGILPSSDILPL